MRHNSRGSILLLALFTLPVAIFALCALVHVSCLLFVQCRTQTAADAASLAIAQQLSTIVIDDPHFGKVALSDYPPVGKAVSAADGEALPVSGINTIIGTTRLDLIIAERVGDENLIKAARDEVRAAFQTQKRLQKVLQAALLDDPINKFVDIDGNNVRPMTLARSIVSANIPANCHLENVQAELGYLSGGTISQTPVPIPQSLAHLQKDSSIADAYRAFVNVPALGEDFYFAGLGKRTALCDQRRFVVADRKCMSSIVRLRIKIRDSVRTPLSELGHVSASACAMPQAINVTAPSAVFVFSTIFGLPSDLLSLSDMLRILDGGEAADVRQACGDFGRDPSASLIQCSPQPAAASISQALIGWLRTARLHPCIDNTAEFFNQPLRHTGLTIFDFSSTGRVMALYPNMDPFREQCVCDQQTEISIYNVADTKQQWALVCHNQVQQQGTVLGGLHAGQPMAADAINWYELPIYGGNSELEKEAGKGQFAIALEVAGNPADQVNIGAGVVPGAISLSSATFKRQDGCPLSAQPRKSFYGGGEAIYMELRAGAAAQGGTT